MSPRHCYPAAVAEFTIAELSQHTGVATRTIRYYQSIGLLTKPARNGKEALYTDRHAERLQLIADMRARRMKLDAIADVFESDALTRNSAADWLGLDNLRVGPWSESRSRSYDEATLTELLGDRRAEILDDLVAENYLHFAQGQWHVDDFPLFKAALVLYDAGVSVAVAARMRKVLRTRLASLADELVDVVESEAGAGYAGEGTATDLAQHMDRFRPIAWESAGDVLAQEIDRAISER